MHYRTKGNHKLHDANNVRYTYFGGDFETLKSLTFKLSNICFSEKCKNLKKKSKKCAFKRKKNNEKKKPSEAKQSQKKVLGELNFKLIPFKTTTDTKVHLRHTLTSIIYIYSKFFDACLAACNNGSKRFKLLWIWYRNISRAKCIGKTDTRKERKGTKWEKSIKITEVFTKGRVLKCSFSVGNVLIMWSLMSHSRSCIHSKWNWLLSGTNRKDLL